MNRMRVEIVPIAVALFVFVISTAARGAMITVDSLADPSATGACTLHDAIVAANSMTATNGCAAGTGNDTIQFGVTGTILLGSTLPEVTGILTINGPASGITIDGGGKVRVMQVASGATLEIHNLTIEHGKAGEEFSGEGGGIANDGTLIVTNASLIGNDARFFSSCGTGCGNDVGAGGGIFNSDKLTVTNSTFSDNSAPSGGGIDNSGTLNITNSTFSGNFASGATDRPPSFFGGAIDNSGTLSVTNSTFSDNSAQRAGGDIANSGNSSIKSTILARGGGGNCFNSGGTINDAGYNISDDDSCAFSNTGSHNNTDPMLAPGGLGNNGGPTQTIALLEGSPAVDVIPLAECTDQASPPNPITTDQRGFPRPDAGEQVCDIGAYEFQDVRFAGQPGKPNCRGKSVSALVKQFGDLDTAAEALGFSSVKQLQNAISAFCRC